MKRAAARKPVRGIDVLGKAILHHADPLTRYLLRPFGQHGAACDTASMFWLDLRVISSACRQQNQVPG